MDSDLKAKLLARHLPTDTVHVDGVGDVVVRGLSRKEVDDLVKADLDNAGSEVRYLSHGLDMTDDEAAGYRDAAGIKEVERVLDKILELSGLGEGAGKSDLPST